MLIARFPSTKTFIFQKFTRAAELLLKTQIEQNVLFYPHFLEQNITAMGKEDLKMIFKFLVEKCCKEETPLLMESSMNIGIKILHCYSNDYAEIIVEIFDYYLLNSKKIQE